MNEVRAISLFVRAAMLGSLRKAAIDQGISPQAASHAVMQLEKSLGVRLFHRSTRRLSLTEDGRTLLERASPALDVLFSAIDEVRKARDDVGGLLTVSAPAAFGRSMLWPQLIEFSRLHPDIRVDAHFDDHLTDLVAERADVGFRGGITPAEGTIARRLLPIQLLVCATPDYLARHGAPRSIDDLVHHRCTGYRQANTGKLAPWEFVVAGETIRRDVPAVLCCNDIEAELDAVLSGSAIGLLGSFSAVPHIRKGRLIPLLTRHVAEREGIYLYYRRRTELPRRTRVFIDFIVERLADHGDYHLTRAELAAMAAEQA